jgi:hypothetical protein
MTEFVESSRGHILLKIDGNTIRFRGKTPSPETDGPDWIVFTNIIYDVAHQEYVIGEKAKCYLSTLKDYALQREWALAFDNVKTSNDFSEKLFRYFEWGGPKKEVPNFDIGLSLLIVFVIISIGFVLFY